MKYRNSAKKKCINKLYKIKTLKWIETFFSESPRALTKDLYTFISFIIYLANMTEHNKQKLDYAHIIEFNSFARCLAVE